MKQNKYILSTRNRNTLRFMRKEKGLAAEDISKQLGKSQAWLGQIERGKVQSINKDNLVKLLSIYTDCNEHEVVNIENFISTGYAEKNETEITEIKINSCVECPCFIDLYPACNLKGILIRKMTFEENSEFPNECPLKYGKIIQIKRKD